MSVTVPVEHKTTVIEILDTDLIGATADEVQIHDHRTTDCKNLVIVRFVGDDRAGKIDELIDRLKYLREVVSL